VSGKDTHIDMQAFEQELAAIAARIEEFVGNNPQASVGKVLGELHISREEFMAASAYHQRRGQAYRAARAVQQKKSRTTH